MLTWRDFSSTVPQGPVARTGGRRGRAAGSAAGPGRTCRLEAGRVRVHALPPLTPLVAWQVAQSRSV